MLNRTLENRIERAEQAAKAQSKFSPECLSFPENESSFFAFEVELEMLTEVKCPVRGNGSHLASTSTWPSGFVRSKRNISGPTTASNIGRLGSQAFSRTCGQ